MNPKVEQAISCFEEGFYCSQAVLVPYADQFGLKHQTALRISSGFGAGMGGMAKTCGAVTGAFLVLGLKYGSTIASEKGIVCGPIKEFVQRFEARNASIGCQELLDCDISTPAGDKAARENNLYTTICPKLVQDAAEILEEMLTASEKTG